MARGADPGGAASPDQALHQPCVDPLTGIASAALKLS
jgi:hypothetical protein